jgi:hypothetical protein
MKRVYAIIVCFILVALLWARGASSIPIILFALWGSIFFRSPKESDNYSNKISIPNTEKPNNMKLPSQWSIIIKVMTSRVFKAFLWIELSVLVIGGIYLLINRELYTLEDAIEMTCWTIFPLIMLLLVVFLYPWDSSTDMYRKNNGKCVNQKLDKSSDSFLRKFKIFWIHKEYVLKKEKKVIYSAFVLFVGFITTLSVCDVIVYSKHDYFSETWFCWLIFSLVELYLQSKLWSEVFRFKYPMIRKKTLLDRQLEAISE